MSWETQSWAAKQRPGSASAKLVLLGLASCADANHCSFPSVQWLCDFSDLNRKTVIAALQRLEGGMFPLTEDTGARRGRTAQVKVYRLRVNESGRAPGAMTHYVYKLVHPETGQYYIGVRSFIGDPVLDVYMGSGNWPMAARAAGIALDKLIIAVKDTRDDADIAEALAIKQSIGDVLCMNIEYKCTEKAVPKTGRFKDTESGTLCPDNSPVFPSKEYRKRDTEPLLEPIPPSSTNVEDTPKAILDDENGKVQPRPAAAPRSAATELPGDWQAPAISALQPEARALVDQWPSGAYAAMCANFRNHWTDAGAKNRCKSSWPGALANWLIRVHAEVMRGAKAGVSFAAPEPAVTSRQRLPDRRVAAQTCETASDRQLRQKLLDSETGARIARLDLCALLRTERGDDVGVTIICPTARLAELAREVVRATRWAAKVDHVWIEVEGAS